MHEIQIMTIIQFLNIVPIWIAAVATYAIFEVYFYSHHFKIFDLARSEFNRFVNKLPRIIGDREHNEIEEFREKINLIAMPGHIILLMGDLRWQKNFWRIPLWRSLNNVTGSLLYVISPSVIFITLLQGYFSVLRADGGTLTFWVFELRFKFRLDGPIVRNLEHFGAY